VNKGAGMRIKEMKLMVFAGILLMTVVGCYGFNGGSWTDIGSDAGTKFVQVATGNEKTVVARDAAGEVYKLQDGKWEKLGGGKARWIAVGGDGSIFAVGKETRKLYRRTAGSWEVVPNIEKLSRVVVLDESRMWGVLKTKDGSEVWQFEGGKWARPLAADGKTPAAHWRNIAVAPGVFLVTDMSGDVMMRSTKIAPVVAKPAPKKTGKKKDKKAKKAKKSKKAKKASKKTAKKPVKKSAKRKKGAAGRKAVQSKAKGKKKSSGKKIAKKSSKKGTKKSAKKGAKKVAKKKSKKKAAQEKATTQI